MLKSKVIVLAILLILFLSINFFFLQSVGATELIISDNGSESENVADIQSDSSTTISQSNTSEVSNNITSSTETGGNSASENTSDVTSVVTGDASNTTVVENNVNNSLVQTGCCPQDTSFEISGNGSESQNTVNFEQVNDTSVTVLHDVTIKNNIYGYVSTGGNRASENSGTVSIETGDVEVSGVIRNLANTSLVIASSGGEDSSLKISENGAGSENEISTFVDRRTSMFTNISSDIENILIWDLNTGENEANGNNGDVKIKTGDITLELFIENLANLGGVDIDCCESVFDPGEKEEEKEEEEVEEEQEDREEEDGGEEGGEEEGEILPEAAATEAGGPGIVGLSDTSSGQAQALFFFISLVMIALGGKILADELTSKPSRKTF